MADKKVLKGIRMPTTILLWINSLMKKSGRSFSAEVIHLLTLIKEKKIK